MACAKCGATERKPGCRFCKACAYSASLRASADGQPCLSCWSAEAVEAGRCAECAAICAAESEARGCVRGPVAPVRTPEFRRSEYRAGSDSDGYATADCAALAALPVILVAFVYAVMSL